MKNLFPVNLLKEKKNVKCSKLNSHQTTVFEAKSEKDSNYFPLGDR